LYLFCGLALQAVKEYEGRKKMAKKYILSAMGIALLLTACGKAADPGMAQDEAKVALPTGVTIDYEGLKEAENQEKVQAGGESEGQPEEPSDSQPEAEGESAESSSESGEEPDGGDNAPKAPIEEKLTPEGVGWGLSFGEEGSQPAGNASKEELALYDAWFCGDDSEKVIYLTFDCGYENGNTEPILDALKKHGAPATFFVVGHYLETEPELVKRMAEEGHAVGNHTYHHYDINTLDKDAFQKELEDVENLFEEITGKELSPYYRPPEGKCGTNNLKVSQELGYSAIFWSLAHVDWDAEKQPTHEEALKKLTSRIHPGAIVLLHNTSRTNGEILDELLTKWEEMGYTFKALSELTGNG